MTTPRELTLGTAGHIDHGKTALVRALTGIDTDRLDEEKQRGISIDIGFAFLDLGDRRLGIVDVPGHERFIKNMLAGAAGIDLALLVVAADDSVMPQTREHLAILKLLGVEHGLVAITKADAVEADWLDLVETDVRALVRGTFLDGAPVIATSAVAGTGLAALRAALSEIADRVDSEAERPFRMCVDRAFTLQGLGTLITGTVASGAVRSGDEIDLLPTGKRLRVRGIQSHGREVEIAHRGQRAALNVAGAHHSDIDRGCVVAAPGYLRSSRRLSARIDVLQESPWPLRHRSRVRLHVGTQEVIVTVRLLEGGAVEPGASTLAQLICLEPVAAVARQPFVLRSVSPVRTLGGGVILQPDAPWVRRRDADTAGRLSSLDDADEIVRAGAALFFNRGRRFAAVDLCRDADLPAERAEPVLEELGAAGVAIAVGGRGALMHAASVNFWATRVREELGRLHAASPLSPAVPRERLAARIRALEPDLLHGVLDIMIARGDLVGDGKGVARADFEPSLTETQRAASAHVIDAYEAAGFRPPDLGAIARSSGLSEAQLRPLLDLCVDQGALVRIDGAVLLHSTWERELRERVEREMRVSGRMTVSEIKDVLGTSRKYAVPFCEYLDRIGLTRRQGDHRGLATIEST